MGCLHCPQAQQGTAGVESLPAAGAGPRPRNVTSLPRTSSGSLPLPGRHAGSPRASSPGHTGLLDAAAAAAEASGHNEAQHDAHAHARHSHRHARPGRAASGGQESVVRREAQQAAGLHDDRDTLLSPPGSSGRARRGGGGGGLGGEPPAGGRRSSWPTPEISDSRGHEADAPGSGR
jgi:hypothetical protein